jgi:YfiH family protein
VDERRRSIAPTDWTWLHQVHGAHVVTVDEPGEHAGVEADAAVTSAPDCVLAVQVADCAPVALAADGVIGVAHAGWRGLVAGVVPATVAAMRSLGATAIQAIVGPCIHAECYEFGVDDLDRVAGRLGPSVRGVTASATPALDLVGATTTALRDAGVDLVEVVDVCTSCSSDHWSFRARGDAHRQGVVAWM